MGTVYPLNNSVTFYTVIANGVKQSHKEKCIFP